MCRRATASVLTSIIVPQEGELLPQAEVRPQKITTRTPGLANGAEHEAEIEQHGDPPDLGWSRITASQGADGVLPSHGDLNRDPIVHFPIW
jgi:hypothetical protein